MTERTQNFIIKVDGQDIEVRTLEDWALEVAVENCSVDLLVKIGEKLVADKHIKQGLVSIFQIGVKGTTIDDLMMFSMEILNHFKNQSEFCVWAEQNRFVAKDVKKFKSDWRNPDYVVACTFEK